MHTYWLCPTLFRSQYQQQYDTALVSEDIAIMYGCNIYRNYVWLQYFPQLCLVAIFPAIMFGCNISYRPTMPSIYRKTTTHIIQIVNLKQCEKTTAQIMQIVN
jgi:hypothetical protein